MSQVVENAVSVIDFVQCYTGEVGGKYRRPLFIAFNEHERTPVGRVIRGVIEVERDKSVEAGTIEGFVFNEEPKINFGVLPDSTPRPIPHYFPVEFARKFTELTKNSPESRFSYLNGCALDCYVGEICGNTISGKVYSVRRSSITSPERQFDPTSWTWDKEEEWLVKLVGKDEWLNRFVDRSRSDF